ncbi:epoxyqueuosine reductase QueH [Candidatus Saccharibacteria bacterium]|nr:epoxyqueuosine reductase QueH [Candidatus Saccharibacteria bacterium]
MKLLLHTCCAPCSVYCIKTLRAEGIEPTLYFYNPNIHPYSEYILRRDCLKSYAEKINAKLIIEDEYGLDKFVCNVNDETLPDLTKRCETYCYPLRFRKLCEFAKQNGYDSVSTTLLYSIYQKHDFIAKILEELAKEYGLTFLYRDFHAGWREGQDEARAAGLYMQKYCGCVYSEEESTFARQNKKLFKEKGLKPTNENARRLLEKS